MLHVLYDPARAVEAIRVWEPLPQRGGDLKPTPRQPSRSTSLPFPQAKNLINALAYAESLLEPETSWAHVIVVLDQSEHDVADPRAYLALQGRILRRIRDWLHSQDLPAHFLWVREIGPRDGRQHTHILLPLPPHLGDDLAALIYDVGRLHNESNNRAVDVQLNRLHGNTGIKTPASRAGVVRDFLKTMSPKAKLHGVPIMRALGIDNRGQKPCVILGKRSGTSESLNRQARAAAKWRELTTLAELRAALPNGEEARKERNRRRRRRQSARRTPGIALMPPKPSPPRRPDPFDLADDLAADFFDA